MVVHLFLNNNKDLDFLPINSIKNGGVTYSSRIDTELQLLKTSLAKENIIINKVRLKFMSSYLNELSTRINIAKNDISE